MYFYFFHSPSAELKVNVEGKIQVLAAYQREQGSNAIMNATHVVSNGIQGYLFSGLLGTGLAAAQGVVTGAFFLLTGANVVMYKITGNTLNQLRGKLKELDAQESQLRLIKHKIDDAQDWLDNNE